MFTTVIMKLTLVTFLLLAKISCLNILLSTTDSWVTKNSRLLYADLVQKNHTVVLVAPLHQLVFSDKDLKLLNDEIRDGGDFGHLLPSNQMYFKNLLKLDKLNKLDERPKGLLTKKDLEQIDAELDEQFQAHGDFDILHTNQLGFDPLDKNCWFVNSNDPVDILSIATDHLLPTVYPDFVPDLAIVGPTSGDGEGVDTMVTEMEKYLLVKNIPTISINSMESTHIYFKNDLLSRKGNKFALVAKYQNTKIIELIEGLQRKGLSSDYALNIKFPEYDSNCKMRSNFEFTAFDKLTDFAYDTYVVEDKKLVKGDLINVNAFGISLQKSLEEEDEEERFFVNKDSNYYKYKMSQFEKEIVKFDTVTNEQVLKDCNISVNVHSFYNLNSSFRI